MRLFLFSLCLGISGLPGLSAATEYKFANSLGWGADPTVLYHDGSYYGSITGGVHAGDSNSIRLYRAANLGDLFLAKPTLLPLDRGAVGPGDMIWAPDMRFFDGHAYIYYHDHTTGKARVLVSDSSDPAGAYTDKPLGFPSGWTEGQGYDWTVFRRRDDTYWGFFARGKGLFIAAMSDPTTLSRNAVRIAQCAPGGWERLDAMLLGCDEAPQVIAFPDPHDASKERIFVTYSSNTYRRDDYAMGLLTFNGGADTPLDDADVAKNWTKHVDATGNPAPVFSKANDIVSVGSNAMMQGPDGTWWNIYGARYHHFEGQGRQLRAQKIDISSRTPDFGQPAREGALCDLPGATEPPTSFISPPGTYDDTDPRIFYSETTPRWSHVSVAGALNSSVSCNSQDRAYVLFKFVGATIEIKGPKGPAYGTAEVYLDGAYQSDIDLFSSSDLAPATIYSKNFGSSAQHTVMLVNVHAKASHGVRDPALAVDGITTTAQ